MTCQWERFRDTRAPMPSQQRQVQLCQCRLCKLTRQHPNLHKRNESIAARHAALTWKPAPPAETGDDAA